MHCMIKKVSSASPLLPLLKLLQIAFFAPIFTIIIISIIATSRVTAAFGLLFGRRPLQRQLVCSLTLNHYRRINNQVFQQEQLTVRLMTSDATSSGERSMDNNNNNNNNNDSNNHNNDYNTGSFLQSTAAAAAAAKDTPVFENTTSKDVTLTKNARLPSTNPPKLYHWTVCWVPFALSNDINDQDNNSTSDMKIKTINSGISSDQTTHNENNVDLIWRKVTEWRTDLRDPGLYRWPPHVNLLYPFVSVRLSKKQQQQQHQQQQWQLDENKDSSNNDATSSANGNNVTNKTQDNDDNKGSDTNVKNNNEHDPDTKQPAWNDDVLNRLKSACQACEPFNVQLSQLGTFGGKTRGVLWVQPDSTYHEQNETNEKINVDNKGGQVSPPLVRLQALLQDQLPFCNDQQRKGDHGRFNPHMTLSHFASLEQAQEAKERLLSRSFVPLTCRVDQVFVLERVGDDGQFKRVVTLRLGQEAAAKNATMQLHEPPLAFEYMMMMMMETEPDWVREERMQLKQRRNRGNRRGRRSPRSASPSESQK